MKVDDYDKTVWSAQFGDRNGRFDDEDDIFKFIQFVHNNQKILDFLKQYSNGQKIKFKKHPWGRFKADLAMYNAEDQLLATFDLERWFSWDKEFPHYYSCLSFLEKKSKHMNAFSGVPFIMVWMNRSQNKFILTDDTHIKKYKPFKKYFKFKNRHDTIRELKYSDGYIFGDNLTQREINIFNN